MIKRRHTVECQQCKEEVPQCDAIRVEKFFGETLGTNTLHFCNETCASEYYLEYLRRVQ